MTVEEKAQEIFDKERPTRDSQGNPVRRPIDTWKVISE